MTARMQEFPLRQGLGLLGGLLLLLGVVVGLHKLLERASAPPSPRVPVLKVTTHTVPLTKTYIGITQSIASVGIRARVKGFLTQMDFIEGKSVKAGQRLFVIEPQPFQAKVDSAQGALDRSLAEEAFQKVQYERMKTLVAKGAISHAQYDETKAKYEAAIGQVQVQRGNLEDAKINLSYCYVNSPIEGIIGERKVDVGNLVGAGGDTLLATVVKLDPLYVQFSPSTQDFADFLNHRQQQPFPVEVRLPHVPNLLLKGSVNLVNNEVATSTSTVLMRASIHNPEPWLLPGLYVRITLLLGHNPHALTIPKSAILETQGQKTVFIIDKNHHLQSAPIETAGEYQHQAIIKKGLHSGDVVVIQGIQQMQLLPKGMTVIPIYAKGLS